LILWIILNKAHLDLNPFTPKFNKKSPIHNSPLEALSSYEKALSGELRLKESVGLNHYKKQIPNQTSAKH
jgi:hypothetical protein